jgi:hypothetical protein
MKQACNALAQKRLKLAREHLSHSGDEQVREGSTMPAKCTGIGSWITGNSTGVLRGVDCGDPSGVMMSSALRVHNMGRE